MATRVLLGAHHVPCDSYTSGRTFLQSGAHDFGVVLLDLKAGDLKALEALEQLCEGECPLPIIFVTDHGDLHAAVAAMKLGATDVLEKPYDWVELILVLENAFKIRAAATKRSAAQMSAICKVNGLTPRQRQILQAVVAGLTNKVIARQLALSPRTVEMHRARMFDRLCVSSTSDAIRVANYAMLPEFEIKKSKGA